MSDGENGVGPAPDGQGRTALLARIGAIVAKRFAGRRIPLFERTALSVDEQVHLRDKPRDYLLTAAEVLAVLGGEVIVEIGTMRAPMRHAVDEFDPTCCNDGHSTVMWCHYTSCEIHTVDRDPSCRTVVARECAVYGERVHAYTGDGIAFLAAYRGSVDLLFLDAWDVVPGTPFAEKHLEAYRAIRERLSPRHLVLIDDTDIARGGKGRLLIPELERRGYRRLLFGRQALYLEGV